MDDLTDRKNARLAETRARIDGLVNSEATASADRLADVIETAMGDTETMSVEDFRTRLRETD